MMCTNKEMFELLPAHLERKLDQAAQANVEQHLASCGDCRAELEILRMLAAEPVPDPGEAFWAAMPGKVYHTVRSEQQHTRSWWGSRVPLSITLPRWAWAATAVLIVAAVSWLLVRPAPVRIARVATPEHRAFQTTLTPSDVMELADLSDTEVDAVDLWATGELALLQDDYLDNIRNSAELSIDDRLTELNTEELDSLSRTLDRHNEEG
jgi:predicted anti-sigma-YlaC factor YlaD